MALSPTQDSLLEELVKTHQSMVRGFLRYLGCPGHFVDDVCQDVFLSVFTSSFEHRSDLQTAAYLRKVARHLFLKSMQRDRRRPLALEAGAAEAAWLIFEGQDQGSGFIGALRDCVRLLTGRPAEVIRLRYHEGLQRDAICARLGLSEGGIKSILIRTRARLRVCVERAVAE
ncbi:MAG: RNA polymerase sigma-70 factor (ECF subfamily) [Planctomycetota bacterium]|jgi:RNA polymerase sigma-70 factor (ECF subfamily)